ncbi:transcriptional regulator DEF1 [Nasonia vitripennis]|uniref:Uncharacterized protein n=1 Tax=Nasonia vitripennis TaxID=7425 RepID=A0A7M7GDX1_NASVI|nr:transcriptional regulator DEF1 [Nasonia vitripennis]
MKEPWKKTCNGKVIITLNDEKTTPTEVEVPVDLNWTNRSEKKCSANKAVLLVGVVLVLGLTIVTLFKVQNLVYSTSYINWRMQELESAVSDSTDDVKLIKYKLSLEDREELASAKAEPLIASVNSKNAEIDSQDLKLSESQNQNRKLTNSLNAEPETKNSKEAEVLSSGKNLEILTPKENTPENKNNKDAESTELNDGRDHPNPSDPEEWIKPLVETFDIFGNQPIEDHFIHNVLMKLLMPENNFEVLEFNKMQEANGNGAQEPEGPKIIFNPMLRNKERLNKPLPLPIESILMKTLLPPVSNFKVFHFNEKPEQQQQQQQQVNMEEEMSPKMTFQNMKIRQMLPPIEGIMKSLMPPNNMKIFHFNDRQQQQPQEQSAEEDMPKITIQSIKLKLLPLPPQEDFSGRRDSPATNLNINPNFHVIRLNESPEPSQEVEAPKMPMPISSFNPFPIPLQEILSKTILPATKHIEIVPLRERIEDDQQAQQKPQDDMDQQDRFNPLPIPIQDIVMKMLMPPPPNSESQHYGNPEPQDNQANNNSPDVEITKVPVRTMKIQPFHQLPIPEALMKSMLPVTSYGEPINMSEQHEDMTPPQPQPQQQEQQQVSQQSEQQDQDAPRAMARSTKLNPVDVPWDMAPPPQYPSEPAQN